MISIILGSQNPQLRETIREAFITFFGDDISVEMYDVTPDVPKHPKNYDIMRGAEERIRKMKSRGKGKDSDYLVSAEDGIIRINKRYYYMYYVMIESMKTGKKSTGMGQLLEIPSRHVALVMKTSIENLFRIFWGSSKVDGISNLTNGNVKMKELIYNGTVMAIAGQINHGTW